MDKRLKRLAPERGTLDYARSQVEEARDWHIDSNAVMCKFIAIENCLEAILEHLEASGGGVGGRGK